MDTLKLLVAVAAGYAACRAREAASHGISWETALRDPFVPLLELRARVDKDAGLKGLPSVRRLRSMVGGKRR